MIKAAIILVHGMGHQDPGWSDQMQKVLKKALPDLNIQPFLHETLYSDLVEGKTFQAVFSKKLGDLTPVDINVMFNFHRMEAAFGQAVAQLAAADVARKGFMDSAAELFSNLMRYVAGYLYNSRLKSQIDARIRKALSEGAAEVGKDGCVMMVGHSLGSVVSWSVATDKNHPLPGCFTRLVTLGSPLGVLQSISAIQLEKVPYYWVNVHAPGDIVTAIGVEDPPFSSSKGLVDLRVRRVSTDPHCSLITDSKMVNDWAPMLA